MIKLSTPQKNLLFKAVIALLTALATWLTTNVILFVVKLL